MIRRLGLGLLAILIALDQLVHVVIALPFFVFGLTDDLPDPDETISRRVARYAIRGDRWALVAEYLIDLMFFWQTDANGKRNHCRSTLLINTSDEFE